MSAYEASDTTPHHSNALSLFVVLLGAAVAIGFLWAPYGFSLGGAIEEWDLLSIFGIDGVFFVLGDGTKIAAQQTRPLTILPAAVAYVLGPDSFVSWHCLQIAALFLKAACGAALGLFLTGSRLLAASLCLLVLFYPADTMQLSLRSMHINWAVSLAFAGSLMVTMALTTNRFVPRAVWCGSGIALYCVGALIYEVVIPLAALPVLALWCRFTWREAVGCLRHRYGVSLAWGLAILGVTLRFVIKTKTVASYQADVVGNMGASLLGRLFEQAPALVTTGFYRAFGEAWFDAVAILTERLSNLFVLVLALALAAAFLTVLGQMDRWQCAAERKFQFGMKLVVSGLLLFALGYASFLASPAHLVITQRTFLAAAPGAALAVLGGLVLVAAASGLRAAAVLSVCAVTLAFMAQLYQFDKYNRIYEKTFRASFPAITAFAAARQEASSVVILSETGFLERVWDMGVPLNTAAAYILGQPREIFVCEEESGRLLPLTVEPLARRGACQVSGSGVTVVLPSGKRFDVAPENVGHLRRDGTLTIGAASAPSAALPIPPRMNRVLEPSRWSSADSFFRRHEDPARYECDFEAMWGYAEPCRSFGFAESASEQMGLRAHSYAWLVEERGALLVDLLPQSSEYELVIQLYRLLVPLRDLKVVFNGQEITVQEEGPFQLRARIPEGVALEGENRLEFHAPLDPNTGLSMAFDRVTLEPIAGASRERQSTVAGTGRR